MPGLFLCAAKRAQHNEIDDTHAMCMRVWMMLVLAVGAAACPGDDGTYNGGERPDAGFVELITVDDIGVPCVFDPTTGESPRLQCRRGLECVIRAKDSQGNVVLDPLEMAAPAYQDQFTMDLSDGRTMGICTLVAAAEVPLECPLGTTLKGIRTVTGGLMKMCVRTCSQEFECGRSGEVCDVRYLTLDGVCVKPCTTDLPDCVQNDVVNVEGTPNALLLHSVDYFGATQCNRETGGCEAITTKGTAGLGAQCGRSADCVEGAACFQPGNFPDSNEVTDFGFCASAALFNPETGVNSCSAGTVPQPGLTFGYDIPLVVFINPATTMIDQVLPAAGYCFFQCQSLETCRSFAGTSCGEADTDVFEAPWNNTAMCLPPVLLRELD
jgi:hypothetical protein